MGGGEPRATRATRDRLVAEAMRLFGERGYAATSVSQIEKAAGLSPGSGSLYRHFPSKQHVLAAGVREQIAAGRDLLALLASGDGLGELPPRERLAVVARAGLERLEDEKDFTRVLLRDLQHFPELLDLARRDEIGRVNTAVAHWLGAQALPDAARDWDAVAVVLVCAVTHYWLLGDIFGDDPTGIDEDRFVDALTSMTVGLIIGQDEPVPESPSASVDGLGTAAEVHR